MAEKPKGPQPRTLMDVEKSLAAIHQKFGLESVRRMSADARESMPVFPTGSLSVDMATGIGGWPRGRIVEVYGPESAGKTTLCLHAIAEAQAAGGVCMFIDAEHALDPTYASAIGVRMEDLLVSQPDHGEQALGIAEEFISSGSGALVVIDSVAALVPEAELLGEMGQLHVGLQARLMSQALRKITGVAKRTNTTVMFINQIRHKIGVLYGCSSYDTRVTLADGTSMKIGKLVNQQLDVEVLAYDPVTGEVRPRRVVDWHDNGPTDSFLSFICETAGGGNGRCQFKVTPEHHVFVPGEAEPVAASTLRVGDRVLTMGELVFNSDQRALALSQVLGDGSVRRGTLRTQLRVLHGWNQAEYAQWKAQKFGDLVSNTYYQSGVSWSFSLRPSSDLSDVVDGPALITQAGIRGVALWYLDDGTFGGSYAKWGHGKAELCVKRWTDDQRHEGALRLEGLGLPRPSVSVHGYLWSGVRTHDFQKAIAPFVPPCMAYKIHPKLRHLIGTAEWDLTPQRRAVMVPSAIQSITRVSPGRRNHRYDLTVEGDHTYLVDGCAVHNSPETTTGGNALKFYASMRVDVRRKEQTKDAEGGIQGNFMKVKFVKNKCAPPFKECEVEIVFGQGIDRFGDIMQVGVATGVIERKGASYSHRGERLGQGRAKVLENFAKHPEFLTGILADIRALK